MKRGVLVGCDKTQEWMLPWWFSHFKQHNSTLPVAFVDLGMSHIAKAWCQERGYCIQLKAPQQFLFPKEWLASDLQESWEEISGLSVWRDRFFWFCKPFALLQTPFEQTVWLDLDCEVRLPLSPLFAMQHSSSMAVVKQGDHYNSGLVVYKDPSFLLPWSSACASQNDRFLNDAEVLNHLVQNEGFLVKELPKKYNWIVGKGVNPEAAVLHWSGAWGKEALRNHILSA